jgi:uncharacterized protein YvpB
MTDMSVQNLTPPTAPVAFSGPQEVLVASPVMLKGTYDPGRVLKVTLVAEDKYPLTVTQNPATRSWQVNLDKGFQLPGTRWLRLKAIDKTGKAIATSVVYLTVSKDPLNVGEALSLRLLRDTWFKLTAADSADLTSQQKLLVKAGQSFSVSRYGFVGDHLKIEFNQPTTLLPVGSFGFFYADHVELKKGSQVLRFDIEDVPTIPGQYQMLVERSTTLKATTADSSTLPPGQKHGLLQGQTLALRGYAPKAGYFRVTLVEAIPGFGDRGFIYRTAVEIKTGSGKLVEYDPDSLTLTSKPGAVIKKRLADAAQLKPEEKAALKPGEIYGVSSYQVESAHLKVALTEEIPNYGNSGYLPPVYLQLRRGAKVISPYPSQVELNVPYFSQRDNPRYPNTTCNVTAIGMAFHYLGKRARWGSQIEDELFQWCKTRYGVGSQTDHNVLSALIKAYGFKTSFSTKRSWLSVKEELINRRPVILGGDFTATGHIICLVGFTPEGYIVNDPWGDALSGYRDTEGRKLLYPYSYMDRVAGPDGHVWAHFIAKP